MKVLRFFFLCIALLFSTYVHHDSTIVFAEQKQTLFVKHLVKGNNVFVECIVDQFTFTKGTHPKKDGQGRIYIYVNGKRVGETTTAAFVIRGLPVGKHAIRLELVHNDASKYNISHEFTVTIS
ncbi:MULTISPECIES: hypothetical protein [Anoxybacillus]|uniref:Uncharacterized protein n=2 Tax=Anoxybacillus flavithermus TaxID=33934 RepID=A0AAX2A3Z8_9BACL|nr:hypothetical protein [Anoxybacillus flavithermus]ELK21416.1 hypothetical protein AF6_1837 [Anoxybacillus flavithermus TNO-09.006]MCG6172413.1 hypothetical protein [Anoxybacillus sp. LAT_11]MCG6175149.1 hypothetical protein [Anoxybacillus sp. LAT_31]MCG6177915.1 hypothetical protein [Anoxybacillus sp. LAT_35]MCG6180857.1 hypothetical protein [Anoxybacillus sp. LAT_33]MCG6185662.1 hypothetical protein [Anoxybacillus sp. LAT_26]MCG6195795.1 hypothetical protein [Anoxybacillus sp. LAT_38]